MDARLLMLVLLITVSNAFGVISYKDGNVHVINNIITDNIEVDNVSRVNAPLPGTSVEIVFGGRVPNIAAYNTSSIDITGGLIQNHLDAYENTEITMTDGEVMDLICMNDSTANISGGIIWALQSHNDSHITLTGCTFKGLHRVIYAENNGQITIYGNFSSYGLLPAGNPYWDLEQDIRIPSGHISGTLQSGDIIDVDYYIFDQAAITLAPIPEPTTFLLLGLGGLLIKRKW